MSCCPQTKGVPVFCSDVASVTIGHQPRLGIAGQDNDDDIVQGIVLMRRGEQSMPTIRGVEEEVQNINSSGILPPGVSIEPIYDRTDLIAVTTRTVLENMLVGMVLIFLVQWLFLGDLRSAVIVAATIPFALLFAVAILMLRGESANLLSVGAIDFGLVVDATVIMMENIFRHLSGGLPRAANGQQRLAEAEARRAARQARHHPGGGAGSGQADPVFRRHHRRGLCAAVHHVGRRRPYFRADGAHLCLCHRRRRDRHLHRFSGAGRLSCCPKHMHETETWLLRFLHERYVRFSEFALANRVLSLGGAGAVAGFRAAGGAGAGNGIPAASGGRQFLDPRHHAGDHLAGDRQQLCQRHAPLIGSYPEVVTAVSQNGRPDDGTDATGFFNAEFFVPLKPMSDWPGGMDKAKLTDRSERRAGTEIPRRGLQFLPEYRG